MPPQQASVENVCSLAKLTSKQKKLTRQTTASRHLETLHKSPQYPYQTMTSCLQGFRANLLV